MSAFTAIELQLFDLIKLGKSNSEIAFILSKSPLTVKRHVERMLAKAEAADRTHLVYKVMQAQIDAMRAA